MRGGASRGGGIQQPLVSRWLSWQQRHSPFCLLFPLPQLLLSVRPSLNPSFPLSFLSSLHPPPSPPSPSPFPTSSPPQATGKAMVLDEIINYVRSLQLQVEVS